MFEILSGDTNSDNKIVFGKTPFPKWLRWKMKTDEVVAGLVISPPMAEEMLAFNDRNRRLRPSKIKHYARQMTEAKWDYNRVPIIFSPERLIDGQHRLFACVQSGIAFKADVVFGAPDRGFYTIDCGGTRDAADIFQINGVPNNAMAAAATRFLMAYDAGKTSSDNVGGMIPATLEETYQAYLAYEGLQESLKYGRKFAQDRLPCPSVAAAVHYLCAQRSRRAADEYFDKIASGVGFSSKGEPAKKVRDFLTRSDSGRIRPRGAAAAIIAGWNATRTNKRCGDLAKLDKVGRVI